MYIHTAKAACGNVFTFPSSCGVHLFLFVLPAAFLVVDKIVEQVLVAKRFLESVGDPAPVTGVVFMGMGEPFDNYER